MYNIVIDNITDKYEFNELIKLFMSPEHYVLFTRNEYEITKDLDSTALVLEFNDGNFENKNLIKQEIFQKLNVLTGVKPPWGIHTGVRPVKLVGELYERLGSTEKVREHLENYFLLSAEKINLVMDIWAFQQEFAGKPDNKSVGLYIGIPFCPTRCLYCSFTSNQVAPEEIDRYLEALYKEISFVGKRMKETGLSCETVYMGGGTPTTLSDKQLDSLLTHIEKSIDLDSVREFTVEAGRPDTITHEKLSVLKKHNIERISINPQSMKEKTLSLIGRSHSREDIINAFEMAHKEGIAVINADIIAGLPKETPEDFENTLNEVLALGACNITVHTLAVKRASRLAEVDKEYHYKQGEVVARMLEIAKDKLKAKGYRPYYLYRQKHMAGSFENVGYCTDVTPCIYNIRIMEEKQSILALGAGGISKIYFPDENRLERVPNVSNYEIYISRLEEMIYRKENNFFKEV